MPSANRRRHAFSLDDYINTERVNRFHDVSAYGVSDDLNLGEKEMDSKYYRDISDKMKLPNDVQLQPWQYEMLEHKANRNMNAFFALAIKHKLNICMVGGTGSGKTTFTKALSDLVPPEPASSHWKTHTNWICPSIPTMPICSTRDTSRQKC